MKDWLGDVIKSKGFFFIVLFFNFRSSLLVINKPLPDVITIFGKLLFPEIGSVGGEHDQLLLLARYLFSLFGEKII